MPKKAQKNKEKRKYIMLNIHSFLQGMKNRILKGSPICYKATLLVAGYTMVAIVILLNSNHLAEHDGNVIEAYAKAEEIPNAFVKVSEETAKTANIRADLDLGDTLVEQDTTSVIYKMGAINGMAVETIDEVYKEQQEIIIKEDRAQESKAREEAAKKKAAKLKAKEAKEKAAKEKEAKEKAEAKAKELSTAERETLERIVEAEATGEDLKGRILVANVIRNRVKSNKFPNTVEGVVFQKDGNNVQFSPTKDGRYWSVKVTKKTKEAVDKALSGTDYSKSALYFSARSKADPSNMRWFDTHLTRLFRYGGHEFYK